MGPKMKAPQNRFLLELEKFRYDINHAILKPRINNLSLEQLRPVLTAVAHARADYAETLIKIGNTCKDSPPSDEQIEMLRAKREAFDELVAAANALETIIQRDYVDVVSNKAGH